MFHIKKGINGGFEYETLLRVPTREGLIEVIGKLGITGDVIRAGNIRIYDGAKRLTIAKLKAVVGSGVVT